MSPETKFVPDHNGKSKTKLILSAACLKKKKSQIKMDDEELAMTGKSV